MSSTATGRRLVASGSTCAALPDDPNVSITGPCGAALVFTTGPAVTII